MTNNQQDKLVRGGFESKLHVATALKCFPTYMLDTVVKTAKVRNKLSHRADVENFEDFEVSSVCKNLVLYDHKKLTEK